MSAKILILNEEEWALYEELRARIDGGAAIVMPIEAADEFYRDTGYRIQDGDSIEEYEVGDGNSMDVFDGDLQTHAGEALLDHVMNKELV